MDQFLDKFRVSLSKFTLSEIHDLLDVLDGFMGLVSWELVTEKIRSKRLKPNVKNVVDLIIQQVKKDCLDRDSQRRILALLELNDAAHHRNRKWQCIRFTDQVEPVPSSTMKLNENIVSCYRREARDADVLFMEEETDDDGCNIWLMISEKKISKRGVRFLKPIMFVVNLAEPRHAFYSTSNPSESSVQFFARALGFESFEEAPLVSRDVHTMFGMLQRNEAHIVNQPPEFDAGEPISEDGVMDFTQGRQREEYAERVFSQRTNMNELTAHATCKFKGGSIIPGARGTVCSTRLTFTNRSGLGVEEIFKQLIKDNAIQIPLPNYIANFNNVPKTSVELQSHEA